MATTVLGFRFLRMCAGYLQQDAARALNIHPTRLSRIERGYQKPYSWEVKKLAELYGVKQHELTKTYSLFEQAKRPIDSQPIPDIADTPPKIPRRDPPDVAAQKEEPKETKSWLSKLWDGGE